MAAVQHYVPQFLLKNFCSGTKRQIWAFDKHTNNSFLTNIQNVAGERNYYELKIGDQTLSLEPSLSSVESEVAPLFDRIIAERSIGWLLTAERELLAGFVALQMKRGPQMRENYLAIDAALRELLAEGSSGAPVDAFPETTSDAAKAMALKTLTEPDRLAEHVLNKTWLLFEANASIPFYISDNPVSLQNQDKSLGPHRGNLGVAVRGIEIYLPISSTLVLAFYCRSHEAMVRNGVDRMRARMVTDPGTTLEFGPLLDWMRAFRKGTPLRSQPENVMNHNSLQVAQAERYVFCCNNDFSLITQMVESNPELRRGRRIQRA